MLREDDERIIIKLILIVWITLRLSSNFYCYGFLLKPNARESTTPAPMLATYLLEERSSKATIFYHPQMVEYEESKENHKSHAVSNLLEKCKPCPNGVLCVPQIQCPAHVRMKDDEKPQVCDLAGGKFGFCCVTGQNHTGPHRNGQYRTLFNQFMPAHVLEQSRLKFEHLMQNIDNKPVAPGNPDFFHGLVFHSTPQEDRDNFHLTNSAIQEVLTTQELAEEEQILLDDIITDSIDFPFKETALAVNCHPPHHCSVSQSKYRSLNGSCNNLHPSRTHWGSAGQAMERLLPPAYEDGIWMPRQHGVKGSLLTSAREISRIVLEDVDRPHPKYNLMVMQFGQFVAHDVLQSAPIKLENGDLVQCCAPGNVAVLPPESRHFACLPIEVSPHDDFYRDFFIRCMNFVRSSLAPNTECRASYGKQRNKVTHFIDASTVYGSSLKTLQELRSFQGGKLRTSVDFGREMLPQTSERNACGNTLMCYKSGDGRTNQIISLTAIHMLFAREHNRIAQILAIINPHANDEKLFQETRRIVVAELQHIIYNEYLPIVIGPMQMKRFRLTAKHHGYSNDYDSEINPAITNEFATAAFRMGHSSVDGRFNMQSPLEKFKKFIEIPDVMFDPLHMERITTFYDEMLKTLMAQPMQRVDSAITHGLSRFLFRGHHDFGLDLAAINIQRGRDHALRSYNDYLEVMGNRRIRNFNQLPPEIARKLVKVYESPEDIDLWVGGLLEKATEDGIVGSTFSEIIADQFARFKLGDRYFYEYNRSINPGAFTSNQLQEIRKVTLARIICENADHFELREVPPMAFVRTDFPGNQLLRCDSPQIRSMNLDAFRF